MAVLSFEGNKSNEKEKYLFLSETGNCGKMIVERYRFQNNKIGMLRCSFSVLYRSDFKERCVTFMTYTKTTKLLSVLLAAAMLAVMLPVFMMHAAEESAYEEVPAEISAPAGNIAIGATVISQYGGHVDGNWKWDQNLINDGTMNSVDLGGLVGNGGYHTAPAAGLSGGPHSAWVGYDFGEAKTFNTVTIYPSRDNDGLCHGMPATLDIDVSANGTDWVNVYHAGDIALAGLQGYTFTFAATTARYVRVNGYMSLPDVNNAYYMKLCEIAVFNKESAKICPNLALDAKVETSAAHNDLPTWSDTYINDGNRYNLSLTQWDFGQYTGWHTNTGAYGQDGFITYNFEEKVRFDKVVIVPSTCRYHKNNAKNDDLWLPAKFSIKVSDDNATWREVATLDTMPTAYAPIELTFVAQEAQYVRIDMTQTGSPIKLSEIEVYDSTHLVDVGGEEDTTVITKPNTNMALEGAVMYSSVIVSGTTWAPANLNDGVIPTEGGFTTGDSSATGSAWVGITFEHLTTVNKVVLYPAAGSGVDGWSGIPKSFTVEYTTNGLEWITVAKVENTAPTADPVTVSFASVNAKAIRVNSSELYPKTNDGNRMYIQLAEMEVWNTESSTELSTKDTITAFLQTRPNADAADKQDMRLVFVTDLAKVSAFASLKVTVTFTLAAGGEKVLTTTLGGLASDYELYKKITADGEVYTAKDGQAIFGNIVVGIPNGAYTAISVTVVDGADSSNTVYTASTAVSAE